MRILLVVSVALIGLFADQSSLLATLVYRYDFTPWAGDHSANQASGYIEMNSASGSGDQFSSIYDFRVTGVSRDTATDNWGDPVPVIPAITYTKADAVFSGGLISWNENQVFIGNYIASPRVPLGYLPRGLQGNDFAMTDFNTYEIRTSWPFDYVVDQTRTYGDWKFTGTRNVPEAGGTLALLALGTTVVAALRRKL
jgi:hypothetical protein